MKIKTKQNKESNKQTKNALQGVNQGQSTKVFWYGSVKSLGVYGILCNNGMNMMRSKKNNKIPGEQLQTEVKMDIILGRTETQTYLHRKD